MAKEVCILNKEFVIENAHGMKATFSNFGARLVELMVPDRNGNCSNVVLGFDSHEEYLINVGNYFGATLGRVAGRISKSVFIGSSLSFQLTANEGENHLHGGKENSLDRVFWFGKLYEDAGSQVVQFSFESKSGEGGYPGDLSVTFTATLTNENELIFEYSATTTLDTPVNLTNHIYWNLSDGGATSILNHELQINSEKIIKMDSQLLPVGGYISCIESGVDFTHSRMIAQSLPKNPTEPWPGIDNTFMLTEKTIGDLTEAAILYDSISGRKMTITTTEPSLQVYSANRLENLKGRHGINYGQGNSICIETQRVIDNPALPDLQSIVLKPGSRYFHKTIHKFSVE
jgi:aldose 1-epimerase